MHAPGVLLDPAGTPDQLNAACAALYDTWRNATPAARLAADVAEDGLRLASGPYESGLTAPEILWELVPLTHELPLAFHYETGAEPGVRWRSAPPLSLHVR